MLLILQIAFTYLQPFQVVFRTAPISLKDWGIILLIGATLFILVEIEKFFWRRRIAAQKKP